MDKVSMKTSAATQTDSPAGFQLYNAMSFDLNDTMTGERIPIRSKLSETAVLECAQLIEIADGAGSILYYPKLIDLEVGDVIFLRERPAAMPGETSEQLENGVIVQIISKGTARYPQADTKALFRLMVDVRAVTLARSHNEPPEVIDQFLSASFKVRASIVNGQWMPPEGRVVTRNVDIFEFDPKILAGHILTNVEGLNINLGEYKSQPVAFFGGGFEKINLITGMKGAGKSHIAKGIISESLKAGMSAIVFDINNEYQGLENSGYFIPGQNLRFRLDRIQPSTFLDLVQRIAPFAERTAISARSDLPGIIQDRIQDKRVPDIEFLKSQASNIFKGKDSSEWINNMRASFRSSLESVDKFKLIMTEEEANAEDEVLKGKQPTPSVVSLSSVLYNIEKGGSGVVIFQIGGLLPFVQFTVVDLILDTLKDIARRQTKLYKDKRTEVPIYPTIYFEEAHMYMEPRIIDELLPLIRHHGMNVFFITNTPGALPESVFRLMDNLIMTRMLNKKDIDQVRNCGLTDGATIEGFAHDLKEHHALLLSGLGGATNNFPLVFHVRDFGLSQSGETRSMWKAMQEKATQQDTGD